VVDIDVSILVELGIEGDAQQVAFAGGSGLAGEVRERLRQELAVIHHAQLAPLLGHEQPTIRGELHRRGVLQPAGQARLVAKPSGSSPSPYAVPQKAINDASPATRARATRSNLLLDTVSYPDIFRPLSI